MTGPEHYREAEFLLAAADAYEKDGAPQTADRRRFEAQVHATLALTAATAMQAAVDRGEPGMSSEDGHAWYVAAGAKPQRDGDDDA